MPWPLRSPPEQFTVLPWTRENAWQRPVQSTEHSCVRTRCVLRVVTALQWARAHCPPIPMRTRWSTLLSYSGRGGHTDRGAQGRRAMVASVALYPSLRQGRAFAWPGLRYCSPPQLNWAAEGRPACRRPAMYACQTRRRCARKNEVIIFPDWIGPSEP